MGLNWVVDLICWRLSHVCEVFLTVGLQCLNRLVKAPIGVVVLALGVRRLFTLISDLNARRCTNVLKILEMVVEALDLLGYTLQEGVPALVSLYLDLYREQLFLQVGILSYENKIIVLQTPILFFEFDVLVHQLGIFVLGGSQHLFKILIWSTLWIATIQRNG